MTSNTTASDSSGIKSYFLSDDSLKWNPVQDLVQDTIIPQLSIESVTESHFRSSKPCIEDLDQIDISKDSVYEDSQQQGEEDEKEDPTEPRRSTRCTRGQPLERYDKVCTFSACNSNASNKLSYNHIIFIHCKMDTAVIILYIPILILWIHMCI